MKETMVFSGQFAYERLSVTAAHDKQTFMEEAAQALARELLANGCLLHQSRYDPATGLTHEVVTVLAARRQPRLP